MCYTTITPLCFEINKTISSMSNSYISVARVRVIFVFIALTLFSQHFFVETKTESLLIFGDSISAGYGMSKDKQLSE